MAIPPSTLNTENLNVSLRYLYKFFKLMSTRSIPQCNYDLDPSLPNDTP